jgi:hypothetical protein
MSALADDFALIFPEPHDSSFPRIVQLVREFHTGFVNLIQNETPTSLLENFTHVGIAGNRSDIQNNYDD